MGDIHDIASGVRSGINSISSNEAISAVVWGGIGIFLLLFPLLYYVKRFYWNSGQDRKSHFEIISTAFALQIMTTTILSTAAYFSNQLLANSTSYDAKDGIRLFYLGNRYRGSETVNSNINGENSLKLWKIWGDLAENVNSDNITTSGEGGVKSGTLILMYYFSIIIYFTFFIIPIMLFLFPAFSIMRKSEDASKRYSLWEKVGNAMVVFFSIMAIFYLHQAIASGYVSVFGGIQGFSFWDMIQKVWQDILQVQTTT